MTDPKDLSGYRVAATPVDSYRRWGHYVRELESLLQALGMPAFHENKLKYVGNVLYSVVGDTWASAAELSPQSALAFVERIGETLKTRWAAKDAEMALRREANDKLLQVLVATRERAGITDGVAVP